MQAILLVAIAGKQAAPNRVNPILKANGNPLSAFSAQPPFAYQPTDARPRRGEKKTPGLEDRALNHMEQGSTCSFGGRDHHRG